MDLFFPLPTDFPRLRRVTDAMDDVRPVAPPPVEEIGRRLRRAYEAARSQDYRGLSMGEWRRLPYAYWLQGEPPLNEIDGELVRRYWSEVIPQAVGSGPRRAKRWLAPLFFVYCEQFDPREEGFATFASRVSDATFAAEGAYADRLKQLQRDLAFFTPSEAPLSLARALLDENRSFDDTLAAHLLWPRFVDSNLGAAAFEAALSLDEMSRRRPGLVGRLLDWTGRLLVPVEKSPHRVLFAESLLLPWMNSRPADELKTALVDCFVRRYRDPRAPGTRDYQWREVSPEAISVLKRWLAGDTLRGFIRILERTADEIWRYRQKFWMAYYDAGYIEEAWLALGREAKWFAQQFQPTEKGLGYGSLGGGAASGQSVLILKIGHLVFTEWSHNGSLRAYPEDGADTPALYRHVYHGQDLREPRSMDFHGGTNVNPELRHISSQSGSWQRKARDFIRHHTGIHMPDRAILTP